MSLIPPSSTRQSRVVICCPSLRRYTGEQVVGKKILYPDDFFQRACEEMNTYDDGPVPSPHGGEEWLLPLSAHAIPFVSGEIGSAIDRPAEDYIVREHEGYMLPCLRRVHAFPVESVWVKIMSAQTYLARHRRRLPKLQRVPMDALENASHVITDFRAVAGPPEAQDICLSPYALVRKFASGVIGINSISARSNSLLDTAKKFALVTD